MKKTLTSALLVLLAILASLSFVACADVEKTGLWENATYTSDKELGEGAKTITVVVSAEEQSLIFTIHTDKATLREAMDEHQLIGGTEGPYGLTLETVNGMKVDFNEGGYWWGIYKDGVVTPTGIDGVEIADGDAFELRKTNEY